jgi:hypothetical protein
VNWWQPIDTAPKDGTVVLIHYGTNASPGYSGTHIAHWDECWWSDWGMRLQDTGLTHWMPLPSPP